MYRANGIAACRQPSHTAERAGEKVLLVEGAQPDRQKIESRLRRLVEEFGVNAAEAERTVTGDLAREYKVTKIGGSSTRL